MVIEIAPGTVAMISFIAANMNERDKVEIAAAVDIEDPRLLAMVCTQSSGDLCWVAKQDGQPVAAFGISQPTPWRGVAWAFGTRRNKRAIPAITAFATTQVRETLLSRGFQRLEAQSIVTHKRAHRWLQSCGARFECDLPGFGRNGETFKQFVWRS